jgi:hypothetical protein
LLPLLEITTSFGFNIYTTLVALNLVFFPASAITTARVYDRNLNFIHHDEKDSCDLYGREDPDLRRASVILWRVAVRNRPAIPGLPAIATIPIPATAAIPAATAVPSPASSAVPVPATAVPAAAAAVSAI